MATITWLGHAAFKITEADVNIIIDPFLITHPRSITVADIGPVDIVLVTHDHADHVGQAIEICNTYDAMLGTVVGTAEKLVEQGLPPKALLNSIGFNMGGTVEHKGVAITMVPALHTSESGLPVGYIVRLPSGYTLYYAGDTAIFGDMALWGKLYKLDLSLLPIGGLFTMDSRQAALACSLLQTKAAIPMHWGTFPTLEQNTDTFKHELQKTAPECKCLNIAPGESIEV